jgi:hypothetical protein
LSQYWFNRSPELWLEPGAKDDARLHDPQVVAAIHCDMEEYLKLESQQIRRSYTNVQAVHFAQRVSEDPCALSDNDLFDAALESLDGFDLVGTFDNLQGFVDAISQEFALSPILLPSIHANKNRKRINEISPRVLQFLQEANRVDQELLEWARLRSPCRKLHSTANFQKCMTDLMPLVTTNPQSQASPDNVANIQESGLDSNFGTHDIEIVAVACTGISGGISAILTGECLRINIRCFAKVMESNLTVGFSIRDQNGLLIYGTNSRLLGIPVSVAFPGYFTIQFDLENNLGVGSYDVSLALHRGFSHEEGCYHLVNNATSFAVLGNKEHSFEGIVDLNAKKPIVNFSAKM